MRYVFQRHPDSVLDYVVDWLDWLDTGETISSVVWTVPAGLTQPFPASLSGAMAKVWIAGGVALTDYQVACHITTTAGRQDVRTILIKVRA